jgi:hypothetical protein
MNDDTIYFNRALFEYCLVHGGTTRADRIPIDGLSTILRRAQELKEDAEREEQAS